MVEYYSYRLKLDASGLLSVSFSDEMMSSASERLLTECLINIYVEAHGEDAINRRRKERNLQELANVPKENGSRNLNLKWNVTSFEGKELKI